ncbi:actin-binding protein WASF2-like [Passer domesticus]|uniref:actin-binding protein WASF2-like n=1 Tax=Passer domesticus TaxID=48849 RepID=UPI0030FEC23B
MAYIEKLVHNSWKTPEHGGGPAMKKEEMAGKKKLEAAKHLDEMLSVLERRRAMEQKSVQMAPYHTGSNGSVSVPDGGKEELPDMGKGIGEVLGKSDTNAPDPPNNRRIVCPQDVRRSCMIGTVVTLFTVPLSMVLCYAGFRWWKEKKHRAAAAPASRPRRRDSPWPPGSPESFEFGSSQTWPQQQQPQLPKKADYQPSVPPPRPPIPAVKRKPPEIPPPPPLPSPPPWSS